MKVPLLAKFAPPPPGAVIMPALGYFPATETAARVRSELGAVVATGTIKTAQQVDPTQDESGDR